MRAWGNYRAMPRMSSADDILFSYGLFARTAPTDNEMTHTLITDHAAIGVYSNSATAEAAVRELERADISMDHISVVGGDKQMLEAALGYYSPPKFVEKGLEHQGERDGIWIGGLFGLFLGFGSFFMPGIGMMVVLGPLAGLLA